MSRTHCGSAHIFLLALGLTAAVLGGPRGWADGTAEAPPAPARPNVLLITVDTCRVDRIRCYGYGLARTPAIDSLAEEGVRCTNAVTPAPITLPAHTSILTGLFPPAHGIRDNGVHALSKEAVTLAECFKKAGYATHAAVSALVLGKRYGLTQGFDSYDDDLWDEDKPPMFMIPDRAAPKTAQRVVDWLEQWQANDSDAPFFLWVHFFDPHHPWQSQVRDRYLCPTPYDAEVAQADDGVEMLLGWLREKELLEETAVVLTADHGESLGEHGEKTHAIFIYDATVHVPLIWRYPALLPQGLVYEAPVRAVDIMPTLLAMAGLPEQPTVQGQNLLAAFQQKEPAPDLPQYCESLLCELGFGMAPLYGIRADGLKYIRAPKPEVYDLVNDPKELTNLFGENAEKARELDNRLEAVLEESRPLALESSESPLDEETEEMLLAMGYLTGRSTARSMEGMDPKDGIVIYSKLEEARNMARQGRWAACEALSREIVEKLPGHVTARNVLALALVQQNRTEEAKKEYLASLKIDPKQHRVLFQMGKMAITAGDFEEADRHLAACLEMVPGFVEAMVYRGIAAEGLGKPEEAEQWFQKARETDPASPHPQRVIADSLFTRGDFEGALEHYEKALRTCPDYFHAMVQAGVCETRLGSLDAAAEQYQKASRLRRDSWVPSYNLACVRTKQGRNDEAIEILSHLLDEGMVRKPGVRKNLAHLFEKDEDLAPLHEMEAFRALADRLKEAPGPNPARPGLPQQPAPAEEQP